MSMRRVSLIGTTTSAGAVTVSGSRSVLGRIYAVKWIDGDLADGVDFVLTAVGGVVDTTILTVADANSDAMYYPRALVNAQADGAALTGTSGGDRDLPVIDGTLTLAITSGGDTKTGGCIVYYYEG